MYIGLNVKYLLLLSEFKNLDFLDRFYKNTKTSNSMKIRLVEAKLTVWQMGRLADMPKLTVYKTTRCTKFLWLDFIFH